MGDNSKIEWTDTTWNPILGCAKVSEGCRNCYAMRVVHRLASNPNEKIAAANAGLTKMTSHGPEWTGTARLIPERLDQPRRWKRPRMIFVNSLSDIGHRDLSGEAVMKIVGVMADADHHTFQVLSKRSSNLRAIIDAAYERFPYRMAHVWWGVTVENQEAAEERLGNLLAARRGEVNGVQHVRWASVEPLLGPLDLRPWLGEGGLSWVVVGGESGPGARPMELAWVVDVVKQCREAKVPVFFKQGSQANWTDFKNFDAAPKKVRVRQWPRLYVEGGELK